MSNAARTEKGYDADLNHIGHQRQCSPTDTSIELSHSKLGKIFLYNAAASLTLLEKPRLSIPTSQATSLLLVSLLALKASRNTSLTIADSISCQPTQKTNHINNFINRQDGVSRKSSSIIMSAPRLHLGCDQIDRGIANLSF